MSLSDNQLTLDRITELLPINSKDKFLASIVVKEAIKELVERLLNKIFIGSKNVSYKVSFCQREIPKAIEEIFGAELCSEEDLK